ncbi:response regulator transcription factor [Bacillus haimaensis]|uniref:response regulator n=1 Tax=Bacillus haimaensis TaxID=3160967 RepID=UPI003AA8AE4C
MIRIVIAEDQEMLLGTIGSLLNLEEDMEVVGQARNGKEALRLVEERQPDVCIMDVEMPEMSGLEAAEALKESECKVIIMTTFARDGYFLRARNADVRGYLLKDGPSEELVDAVRLIIEGKRIYAPDLADDAVESDMDPHVNELEEQNVVLRPTPIRAVKNYLSNIVS